MSDGKVHWRSIGFLSLLAILLLSVAGCSNPDSRVEKKLAQAQQKLDEGELIQAIEILNQLRQAQPERPDILEMLGFAHAENSDPTQAGEAFAQAALLSPARSELLLYAAQAREEAGNFGPAADHYRVYLTANFDDPSAWQALARLEDQRGLHHEAIEAYLHVYRVRPTSPTAAEIGDLFFRLRNLAQAHHWFTTASEDPGQAPAKAWLGLLRISMEEENWDRAQELVQILDQSHPGQLDSTEMALVRQELRQWREAVEEVQRLQRDQADRVARQEQEKERLAAEEQLERERLQAVAAEQASAQTEILPETDAPPEEEPEAGPPPEVVLLAEAAALFEVGRYGAAAQKYWSALSYDDSSAQVWFDLSRAHFHAESWNDAELTALEALRRDQDRQVFHLHYLNVIKRTQPVRAYLRELERVHQMFPANPEVVLALANTYARSQHAHPDAVRYYNLFLRLSPNDERRREVEQSIRRLNP